eukprot:7854616-Ditylum_brightwellii.AAC.1
MITAQSSAESEIYATDEYTKAIQNIAHKVEEMRPQDLIMKSPRIIYNGNKACVCWAHNLTTKGLHCMQIRENTVREAVQNKEVDAKHIAGAMYLADLSTKEHCVVTHFIKLRDNLLEIPPNTWNCDAKTSKISDGQIPGQTEGGCQSICMPE